LSTYEAQAEYKVKRIERLHLTLRETKRYTKRQTKRYIKS